MARRFAQAFALVYATLGIGGLFLGTVDPGAGAALQGNLGPLILHLTLPRNALDLVVMTVLLYAGLIAGRRIARGIVFTVGAIMLAVGLGGFVIGDDVGATRELLGMHFPTALNALDVITGLLGIAAGFGTREELEAATA